MQKLFILLALSLMPVLFGTGCGGPAEYAVVGTSRAAGTDGLMVVEEIEGGNSLITLTLEHLPPPNRLGDNLTAYVLWIKPQGGTPQKASVLAYDDDERTASGRATTPGSSFEVLVTAERNGNVNSPSEIVVARQRHGTGGGGDDD
jgi:hypothetical protein